MELLSAPYVKNLQGGDSTLLFRVQIGQPLHFFASRSSSAFAC